MWWNPVTASLLFLSCDVFSHLLEVVPINQKWALCYKRWRTLYLTKLPCEIHRDTDGGGKKNVGTERGPERGWTWQIDVCERTECFTVSTAVTDWRHISILEERAGKLLSWGVWKVFLIFGPNHSSDKKMFRASSGNEKQKCLLDSPHVCVYVKKSKWEREREIMGLLWQLTFMIYSLT